MVHGAAGTRFLVHVVGADSDWPRLHRDGDEVPGVRSACPSGTSETASFLNVAADALVEGGELEIFTPSFLVHARKPASQENSSS
ncbi:MAG: hypothetical protein F4209_12575 [Chloroflexi bacterium]|nr:hypothetical protein [Chloroflexota bacterium]